MSFYHSRHDGTQEEQKCPPVDYSFIYLYANNIYYPFTYSRRFRLKHLSAAVSNVPPVAETNVPPVAETNVPPVTETNVPPITVSNVPPPKITKITFIIIIFLISSLCSSMAKENGENVDWSVSLYNIVPRFRRYFHKSIFPRRKS